MELFILITNIVIKFKVWRVLRFDFSFLKTYRRVLVLSLYKKTAVLAAAGLWIIMGKGNLPLPHLPPNLMIRIHNNPTILAEEPVYADGQDDGADGIDHEWALANQAFAPQIEERADYQNAEGDIGEQESDHAVCEVVEPEVAFDQPAAFEDAVEPGAVDLAVTIDLKLGDHGRPWGDIVELKFISTSLLDKYALGIGPDLADGGDFLVGQTFCFDGQRLVERAVDQMPPGRIEQDEPRSVPFLLPEMRNAVISLRLRDEQKERRHERIDSQDCRDGCDDIVSLFHKG